MVCALSGKPARVHSSVLAVNLLRTWLRHSAVGILRAFQTMDYQSQ